MELFPASFRRCKDGNISRQNNLQNKTLDNIWIAKVDGVRNSAGDGAVLGILIFLKDSRRFYNSLALEMRNEVSS